MKSYIVMLTVEERQVLHDLIAAGKAAAQKLIRANTLYAILVIPQFEMG